MFKPAKESSLEIAAAGRTLELASRGERLSIGRSITADLSVNDSRVSRIHATVEWRGGQFVLSDASSFGTWVYMGNQAEPVVLRRTECYLVGSGQMSLGCDRDSEEAPIVTFVVRA
jgi:adenylate cyclase